MDLYIYSDESGVFDYIHNDYFVFAGIIFFNKQEKDNMERKYLHAEKCIKQSNGITAGEELKASKLSNKDKGKLYRSLNNCFKFSVVIDQKKVLESIFKQKKSKQRYLDYAYKICLKRFMQDLSKKNIIALDDIHNINIYIDEHTTATNGFYELKEGLLSEFKNGTYNYDWMKFYPPITPSLNEINVSFCDSKNKTLIRAADIIANRVFYLKKSSHPINSNNRLFVTFLP